MKPDNFHSATIPELRFLPGIHGLRGIAAIAVLVFHLQYLAGINPPENFRFIGRDFGYGAHLFFVLSAFSLMHFTEYTMQRLGWAREYLIKRFFRIAPLFYAMIILELVRQAAASSVAVNIPTILLNVLFVFGFVPSTGIVWGGWTVGVEMIFYVLFPVLLLVIRTPRDALIFLLVALLAGYASKYVLHEQYLSVVPLARYDWSKKTLISNLYFFAVGIYAFKLWETLAKGSFNLRVLIPTVAVGIVTTLLITDVSELFKDSGRFDLMVWAFGFGALCIWQSARPSYLFANRYLDYFGERSYSIYLLHPVIIYFSKYYIVEFYSRLTPSVGAYAFFFCALIVLGAVMVMAEITYRIIEVPGIKLGRKFIGKMRSEVIIS